MAGRATSEDDSRPSDGTTTDGRSKPPLPPWAAPCVPDANRQDPAGRKQVPDGVGGARGPPGSKEP